MMRILVAVCLLAGLGACGGGKKTPDAAVDAQLEGFTSPDLHCPGDPKCMTRGDGQLKVGAGKHVYTPTGYETFTDSNNNRKYDPGEPFTDLNGNGKFDGVWLFGGARAAEDTKTDVEARALAFTEGDITVVIVYIDCIGLLAGDMDKIRSHPMLAGLDIDHIIIGATHAHDAPDTIGLWGPQATTTGREDFVMNNLYDAAASAIKDAVTSAEPAQMVIASTKLINDPSNPMSRTDDWNQDIRDPIIFDPTLTIARFVKVSDPNTTIGTLVNWGDHPEVAHFDSTVPAMITAHYPHWLRDHVENGVLKTESKYAATDLAGLGGVTVFVQGALGGQIGSLRGTHPPGPEGSGAGSGSGSAFAPITMESHAMDQAIGTNAAARALSALAAQGESVSDLPLTVTSAKFNARIDNTYFHVAFLVHLIGPHDLVGYNADQQIDETNEPWLPLRSTYLQIGPLGIITAPGELHPELWVGGYDGSWSWGWPLLNHTTDGSGQPEPNQPDFTKAPAAPYMRDLVLAKPGVRYPVLAGLAEDYIGYIVPAYNYVLDADNPYIVEAKGDHYEEVYSLGPLVEQHAVHPILQLLQIP